MPSEALAKEGFIKTKNTRLPRRRWRRQPTLHAPSCCLALRPSRRPAPRRNPNAWSGTLPSTPQTLEIAFPHPRTVDRVLVFSVRADNPYCALLDYDLPRLFYATETLRYLPNHALQQDEVVEAWLAMIGDQPPWPNPGRLGQYEACLSWSLDLARTNAWPSIRVPCLVLAFEHDVDSPPARSREAAARIPNARFVEIADASHLGVFTHGDQVAAALVEFFGSI